MIKAAVLGSPIEHSLSPFLHKRAYEILQIEGEYFKIEVDDLAFPSFLNNAKESDWTGFSLTMPLKEASFLPELKISVDPRAAKIHSVNTLIRIGDAYNGLSTDVLAFDRLLAQITFRKVAIIGAGGTARAALGALDGLVDSVDVMRRSAARDLLLGKCMDSTQLNLKSMESSLEGYDLVISTTPAGVSDAIASRVTSADGTLIEALYAPWPTNLSAKWGSLGGNVIHGLHILVEQALDQIHLMSGKSFDYAHMRSILLEEAISTRN